MWSLIEQSSVDDDSSLPIMLYYLFDTVLFSLIIKISLHKGSLKLYYYLCSLVDVYVRKASLLSNAQNVLLAYRPHANEISVYSWFFAVSVFSLWWT